MKTALEAVTGQLHAIILSLQRCRNGGSVENTRTASPGSHIGAGLDYSALAFFRALLLEGSINNQNLAFNLLCHYLQLCVAIKSHLISQIK